MRKFRSCEVTCFAQISQVLNAGVRLSKVGDVLNVPEQGQLRISLPNAKNEGVEHIAFFYDLFSSSFYLRLEE